MDLGNKLRQHYYCPGCEVNVHVNDKINHLKGGKHRRKHNIPRKASLGHEEIKQSLHKTLSSDETYVFKPKPRSVLLKVPSKEKSIVPLKTFEDICGYKSIRDNYKSRKKQDIPTGTNRTYINSVTAFWAIRLALDPSIKDFRISINDKDWGEFGDVVVQYVQFRGSKDEEANIMATYAVQFKDIYSNTKYIEDFNEGRFDFKKFLDQINMKKDLEFVKFLIFTTALPSRNIERTVILKNDVKVIAKTLNDGKNRLLDTSDDWDNVFFFYSTQESYKLPTIHLYSQQISHKHIESKVNELISDSLQNTVYIYKDLFRYVENWSDRLFGGKYKLNKEDVLVKLGDLLLNKFYISPLIRGWSENVYSIWEQGVLSVDVTILKRHPGVVSRLCQHLNLIIERHLNLKIDSASRSIRLNFQKMEKSILKMYMFEETVGKSKDVIPLDVTYTFFWKAGLMPLLLEIQDEEQQEQALQVISLLKSLGLTRSYLVITQVEDLQHSLRYLDSKLTFFVTLDDIIHKIPRHLLEDIKINVTETFSLNLKTIQSSDIFFQKSIDAREFFDMSLGRYSFKPVNNQLAKQKGQVVQMVLDEEIMEKLKLEVGSKQERMIMFNESDNNHFLKGVRPNLFCK